MNRLILTEEEKNRILDLHGSKMIMEQGNPKVSQIQTYLKNKGHNLGTSGPNKDGVDGMWGNKTLMAVKTEFGIELDDQGNVKPKQTPSATTPTTTGNVPTKTDVKPEEKIPTNKIDAVTPTNQQGQLQGAPPAGEVKTFGNLPKK